MFAPRKPSAVLCSIIVIALSISVWADDDPTTLSPIDQFSQAALGLQNLNESPDYLVFGNRNLQARAEDILSDFEELIIGLDRVNGGSREGNIDFPQRARDLLTNLKQLPTDPIKSLGDLNPSLKKLYEYAPGPLLGSLFFLPPDADRSVKYDNASLDGLVATLQYGFTGDAQYEADATIKYELPISLVRDLPKIIDRILEELKKLSPDDAQAYGAKIQDPLAGILATVFTPHGEAYKLPTNGKVDEKGVAQETFNAPGSKTTPPP